MMTSRNIYLAVDDLEKVKELASDANLSISAFIRQLIRDRAKVSTDAHQN